MSKLFETTTIKTLTIKNRFVRSATWMGMADRDGASTPELVDHMIELARENVGLIISGFAYVTSQGVNAPQQLGIHNDGLIPGLRAMTDAVHNAGGKIVVQMMHGGLFSKSERTGSEVVGPSVLTAGKDPAGRAMTRKEIKETVDAFRAAAVRTQKAGFDGIQIHATPPCK